MNCEPISRLIAPCFFSSEANAPNTDCNLSCDETRRIEKFIVLTTKTACWLEALKYGCSRSTPRKLTLAAYSAGGGVPAAELFAEYEGNFTLKEDL